ncbi:O-antigen ligase family protein [Shewanella oncorhynchi]|uniref:O-antigen ligase family protein n=1 Tax=Shewanella oncorhynchi TaxID=2726434 RepID=UPI0039EF9176
MQLGAYSWGLLITFACIFLLGTVFSFNFYYLVGIDSEYDLKRFLVIGFIWLASLGLCFVKDAEFIRLSRLTKVSLTILVVLAIVSAFFSKHPFWGMVEITNIGILIIAFYLFALSINSMKRSILYFAVYAGVLFFSVLTFAKYILFLFFSYADAQSFDIHGLLTGYVNVRFFNQLQVMVTPLLFLPFFVQGLAKFKRVSIVFVALHWAVLLQTEARGAMLSLILASVVLFFFVDANTRKQFISTMLQTMLFGICLWLVFIIIIPYWLMDSVSFQIRTGSSGRLDLWLYVLKSIPERLWLGFGPMSFTWAEGKPLPNAHPHNSVMQLLYEYGVISSIVCIAWVLSRIYKRLRYLYLANDVEVIPIIYALLSGLCYSLFSGVVVMPLAQLLLVFVVAMQIKYDTSCSYRAGIWVKIILFIIASVMAVVLLGTYKNEELLPTSFPRIWENGLLHS